MSPISFIFAILAPFLTVSPDNIEGLRLSAEEWYNQSKLKEIFEKYWFVGLALPLLYPIVTRAVQRLYDRIGDRDEDGDIDLGDALAALLEKYKNQPVNQ